MSLLDRDYYRDDESASWSEWLDAHGAAVVIGIICAVFFFQLFSAPRGSEKPILLTREEYREKYSELRETRVDVIRRHTDLYLPAVMTGEVWRFATAFWVHDVSNLIGVVLGMMVIYIMGRMLEPVMGGREFLTFYCSSGLFVILGLFLLKFAGNSVFANQSFWPFESTFAVCGSTGPITALLVLFALKYWDQPIRFFTVTMPSWMAIAILLGVSIVLSLAAANRADILAENGLGALVAWLYQRSGIRISDKLSALFRTNRAGRLTHRLPRLKVVPPLDKVPTERDEEDESPNERYEQRVILRTTARENAGLSVDEQLEAKLDRVLDKVAKSGTDSLTSEERDILLKASEVYKRRRGG